jgi:hypothetical protein
MIRTTAFVPVLLALSLTAGAQEYGWLDIKKLPPPGAVVEAAMKALPKSLSEQQDWIKRVRHAALYPSLEFRYTVGEAVVRDYDVVDRVETVRGSETESASGFETGGGRSSSAGSGSETVTDGGGGLLESRVSSDSQSSSDSTAARSSSTSRRSYSSTVSSGPDSYATGEDFRWANEFGVLLTWDLSRIVFQDSEINAARTEIEVETFRQNVKTQIILTYYDLMEAILLLDSPSYRESIPMKVRRERQAFLLDELTGGFLSSHRPAG